MNSKSGIISKLFWIVCISFTIALSSCTSTPDLPGVDELADDMSYLIRKTKVDYGKGPQNLSDYYRILRFERTGDLEKGKLSRSIQYRGYIELLETVYDYGRYGHRAYLLSSKLGFLACKGKIKKGTVVSFTGTTDYELTDDGWKQASYSVSMESELAPVF